MIRSLFSLASVPLILPNLVAFACSCFTTGSAYTWLRGTEAVFVGRVIEDSGEGIGRGPAKMVVEEVLHGLPRILRLVIVDTLHAIEEGRALCAHVAINLNEC